jgi:hypothetical protein
MAGKTTKFKAQTFFDIFYMKKLELVNFIGKRLSQEHENIFAKLLFTEFFNFKQNRTG